MVFELKTFCSNFFLYVCRCSYQDGLITTIWWHHFLIPECLSARLLILQCRLFLVGGVGHIRRLCTQIGMYSRVASFILRTTTAPAISLSNTSGGFSKMVGKMSAKDRRWPDYSMHSVMSHLTSVQQTCFHFFHPMNKTLHMHVQNKTVGPQH